MYYKLTTWLIKNNFTPFMEECNGVLKWQQLDDTKLFYGSVVWASESTISSLAPHQAKLPDYYDDLTDFVESMYVGLSKC